jgi:hypothetical protein
MTAKLSSEEIEELLKKADDNRRTIEELRDKNERFKMREIDHQL